MNCQYCLYINTVTSSTNSRQINGIVYYFIDRKNFKQYVFKCCLLKYAFNEPNRTEDFNNRILQLMKIRTCKYILVNDKIPVIVYELKFKNTEEFKNPYGHMFGVQQNVTVNRNISLQEIKEKYEFINQTKYNNYLLQSQVPAKPITILNENICETIERVYIIHDAVSIAAKENVYKIGRTSQQDLSRFKNYSKGSKLLFLMICNNSIQIEKDIIELFKTKYIHKQNRGAEYFEGEYNMMIKDIINIIFEYNNKNQQDDVEM